MGSYETVMEGITSLRFFKAEVRFNSEEGLVLIFEGPCKSSNSDQALDHREYSKKLGGTYAASLQEVQDLIKDVFLNFGDYHEATNNCQHFVSKVLDRLQLRKCSIETQRAHLAITAVAGGDAVTGSVLGGAAAAPGLGGAAWGALKAALFP